MLNSTAMRVRSFSFAAACLVVATACAREARAQAVSQTAALYPDRFVNGQDVGVSTRPQNLNPLGISFADCAADMGLRFSVSLSGFNGSQHVEVWASKSSQCTNPTDRGIGAVPVCWQLDSFIPPPNIAQTVLLGPYRVQNIVGPQNSPPNPVVLVKNENASACLQQLTFLAVQMNINFVPVDSSGNLSGTQYTYQLNTDLVGPPAPSGVSENVGDTLMNVTWTANSDSDTTGYDIFIDPIPGQEGAEASVALPEPILVCPDTGAAGIVDAADDSGLEASTSTPTDAGCFFVNVGGTGESVDGATVCNDSILASSIVQDGGTGALTTTTVDDAGDEAGTIESGNGGISTIPTQFLVNGGNGTGVTVADKSAGQFTISGLQNGTTYTVVVAAVDAYGNVGPSSSEVCDFPAPTQDFWRTYKADGGGAGGGFCALEAAGAPVPSLAGAAFLVSGAALVRRRKRRTR
jgi:hypothetical protein